MERLSGATLLPILRPDVLPVVLAGHGLSAKGSESSKFSSF